MSQISLFGMAQLLELPGLRAASPEEVDGVHSYVDELRETCQERAPAVVADIGDPGNSRNLRRASNAKNLPMACEAQEGILRHSLRLVVWLRG